MRPVDLAVKGDLEVASCKPPQSLLAPMRSSLLFALLFTVSCSSSGDSGGGTPPDGPVGGALRSGVLTLRDTASLDSPEPVVVDFETSEVRSLRPLIPTGNGVGARRPSPEALQGV